MSFPDEDGFVTITGTAGSVEPEIDVLVVNESTGYVVLATVGSDGSFSARIPAETTDRVVILLRDLSGNETRIDPGPFVRRDPVTGEVLSIAIDRRGGSIETTDGIVLAVPAGAIQGSAEVRVSQPLELFELPPDIAADSNLSAEFESLFTVGDRIAIEATISRFAAPLSLTFPAPPGSADGDAYVLVRSRSVTAGGAWVDLVAMTAVPLLENPVRTVGRVEVVETASVVDEGGMLILRTSSPPFPGVTEPGVYTLLRVQRPLTFVAGEVRRNTAGGSLIEGAAVFSAHESLATRAFVALTSTSGRFVIADASVGGSYVEGSVVAAQIDVRDHEFSRTISNTARGTVGPPAPPGVVVSHLEAPFVLPEKLPQVIVDILGDITPPVVNIFIDGASVSTESAASTIRFG